MKIVHLSTTHFGDSSVVGGGERYSWELATQMAAALSDRDQCTLVSFSDQRKKSQQGRLQLEWFRPGFYWRGEKINPANLMALAPLFSADVIHIHHLNTFISDCAALLAWVLRKPVFVTDYGGGASFTLNRYLPVERIYHRVMTYSQLGLQTMPSQLRAKTVVIPGGIDLDHFVSLSDSKSLSQTSRNILFVGRILPHKGVDVLIEALAKIQASDVKLKIVGRPYHAKYLADLKALALRLGLVDRIDWIHGADDQQLISAYQNAWVTVLPSVHTDCYGQYNPLPELMGFTLLEAQACGCPVICSDSGAMEEFVMRQAEGESPNLVGQVVAEKNPLALAQALDRILNVTPEQRMNLGNRARSFVSQWSWKAVVAQHLEQYERAFKKGRKARER